MLSLLLLEMVWLHTFIYEALSQLLAITSALTTTYINDGPVYRCTCVTRLGRVNPLRFNLLWPSDGIGDIQLRQLASRVMLVA